tara:strand:- start:210 stop:479 length:270 start_codon:yes stop_codon:yes gene_type:complete
MVSDNGLYDRDNFKIKRGYKSMTIQDIMNAIRDMKANFQNGNINSEELVEQMEDLVHDVEGTDAYNGFGTTMEDDGFYDTPDFTQLVVD